MTGNAKAMAVQPALERRWDDAPASFDLTTGIGVLGVLGRADTVEEVSELVRRYDVEPVRWYGVWLFVGWLVFNGAEPDPADTEHARSSVPDRRGTRARRDTARRRSVARSASRRLSSHRLPPALLSRNLTNYIARSLLEADGFRPDYTLKSDEPVKSAARLARCSTRPRRVDQPHRDSSPGCRGQLSTCSALSRCAYKRKIPKENGPAVMMAWSTLTPACFTTVAGVDGYQERAGAAPALGFEVARVFLAAIGAPRANGGKEASWPALFRDRFRLGSALVVPVLAGVSFWVIGVCGDHCPGVSG
jgi:hypothetical protein